MAATKNKFCDFDATTMTCTACGYQAASLPTFRVCRSIMQMADEIVRQQARRRIRIPPLPIGSAIARALAAVGITGRRVEAVIRKPCGCAQRQLKLDKFGAAVSQCLERTINAIANIILPHPVTDEDVAAVCNALVRQRGANQGLVRHAARPNTRQAE